MMRHFYYTIQTLLHERGVNIIKIISMTLGIYGWTFYLWSFFSGYA